MAYDLLTRRQTRTNWSRHSYLGPRARLRSGRMLFLATYEFAPDPTPTTDEERQFIAKLAVLKMNADGGNKKAAKEWKATMAKVAAAKKRADSGDPKAKRLMTVLNESGLFDGVQSMSVTGGDEFSTVPPEYRDAYKHTNSLARAYVHEDKKAQAAESKWLTDQGWSIQLPKSDDAFKAIIVSHPKLPKKIRVNVIV